IPFLLTACSLQRTVPPEVSVVNVLLENVTVFETVAVFTIRVDNENPFPLEIDGGVHRFYLNDNYVGKGFDETGFTIPRLSSTTQEVRVHLSNLRFFLKLQSLLESSTLSYRIESTLYTNRAFDRDLDVTNSGSLDLAPAPGAWKQLPPNGQP
ncbi:MAG: LEA type 2 family protein, partial [Bdellovibrionales bacterium]|nr:LEA type 2 family protein [Bdellovibrionales bacterium]